MVRQLIVIVLLASSDISAALPGEAVYNGKPLDYWMKLARSRAKEDQLAAMRSYVYFASNGQANEAMMRQLADASRSEDSDLRRTATEAFGKVAASSAPYVRSVGIGVLLARFSDEDKAVRDSAVRSMVLLARVDREAVCKQLLSVTGAKGDSESKVAAFQIFAELGDSHPYVPQVLAAVRQGLASDDIEVRRAAIRALSAVPPTKDTMNTLTTSLTSDDEATRVNAARALADLGRREGAFVDPYLVQQLKSERPEVQRGVLDAVALMGSEAHATLLEPVLTLVSSPDRSLRQAALVTAGRIGTGAPDRVAQVLSRHFAAESDDDLRIELVRALGQIGVEQPAVVIRPLVTATKDPSAGVRAVAAEGLASTAASSPNVASPRPEVAQASQSLAELLRDPSVEVRRAAIAGLGRLSEVRSSVLDAVGRATQDPDETVRKSAEDALAKLQKRRKS